MVVDHRIPAVQIRPQGGNAPGVSPGAHGDRCHAALGVQSAGDQNLVSEGFLDRCPQRLSRLGGETTVYLHIRARMPRSSADSQGATLAAVSTTSWWLKG